MQVRDVDAFHAEVLQTTSLKERKSDGFAKHQGDRKASPQFHAGVLGGFAGESASFRQEQSPRTVAHSKLRLSHKAFEVLWRKTSPARMAWGADGAGGPAHKAATKSAGLRTVKLKSKEGRSPGDLTRQFSQVI